MARSLPLIILLMFVVVPLIEIALLIRLGQWIGFWETILLVIATAVIGTSLLRSQGFSVLSKFSQTISAGEMPIEPLMEGMLLLVAGAFLLTPGLLTDATGFILLVPAFRGMIAKWGLRQLLRSGSIRMSGLGDQDDGPDTDGFGRGPGANGSNDVIDGEFERVDERTVQPGSRPPNTDGRD